MKKFLTCKLMCSSWKLTKGLFWFSESQIARKSRFCTPDGRKSNSFSARSITLSCLQFETDSGKKVSSFWRTCKVRNSLKDHQKAGLFLMVLPQVSNILREIEKTVPIDHQICQSRQTRHTIRQCRQQVLCQNQFRQLFTQTDGRSKLDQSILINFEYRQLP